MCSNEANFRRGGLTLPIYLDSFVVGLVANLLGLIIGSALTQPTSEEKAAREKLFTAPEGEMIESEVKKTKRTLMCFMLFGALVAVTMILLWVLPYWDVVK